MIRAAIYLLISLLLSPWLFSQARATTENVNRLVIASKTFNESVILGEILTLLAASEGLDAMHWRQLGGTRVVWEALLAGDVDVYVDYTGTLNEEILRLRRRLDFDGLERLLREEYGAGLAGPLGFNNSYAIGVPRPLADRLNLETVSDLARFPDLKLGFSNPFMNRRDGWPGMKTVYGLPQSAKGLAHDLALKGVGSGQLDATDVYTTDAEIPFYDLVVLRDDRNYFPDYSAVIVYSLRVETEHPGLVAAFNRLSGAIDAATMREMNHAVKLSRRPPRAVASDFLADNLGLRVEAGVDGVWPIFWRHTRDHFALVSLSLGAAIIIAIPLGIIAYRRPTLGRGVLGSVSVVQTIPSLAMFVFLIPLLGIGYWPAVLALFVYSLLPIVRNTHAGLAGISGDIRESAVAIGLPPQARLRLVELPLALPTILAGIKTSAVINVGTATLGALIGAGGYGQPILTGIRLDDTSLILWGAVPAAVLALIIQYFFDGIERLTTSKGLRESK